MFVIKKTGHDCWRVRRRLDPQGRMPNLIREFSQLEVAKICMLMQKYGWPKFLAEFAVENDMAFNYAVVRSTFARRLLARKQRETLV